MLDDLAPGQFGLLDAFVLAVSLDGSHQSDFIALVLLQPGASLPNQLVTLSILKGVHIGSTIHGVIVASADQLGLQAHLVFDVSVPLGLGGLIYLTPIL